MNKVLFALGFFALSSLALADRPANVIYQHYCTACHTTGVAGAPKLHNVDDWKPRLAKGTDALMKSIHNGLNAMPPKGLCQDCTDSEYRSLIDYMSSAK